MAGGTLNTNVTQTLQLTSSLQQQVGTQLNNSLSNIQYNLGNFVQNISILPYIPSATIRFDAVGMKPNTRVYAYFCSTPVSNWCATITDLVNWSANSVANSALTAPLGTPMYTDSTGKLSGVFKMPANTFSQSQCTFELNDISDLSQGIDAITTQADGTYYGSTLSVAQGQSLLNTRQTVLSSTEVTQQQQVQGLAVETDTTQQYIPDPPPATHGGSGCGCCFTMHSKVYMADDSVCSIQDVKVGDQVWNFDRTQLNTVKYIETTPGLKFEYYYSPSKNMRPFITMNHPIYINGALSSVDPDTNYEWYPFLGYNEKLTVASYEKSSDENVYNLWVDGDGTYMVNGIGTTSMVGDGGLLRIMAENNYITTEQVNDILFDYTLKGKEYSQGAYSWNVALGKLNSKLVAKLVSMVITTKGFNRKIMDGIIGLTGFIVLSNTDKPKTVVELAKEII